MSANLYDLLDVDEDATSAEIRTAWKAAIADLDPTERRFRAYNDAAGVLLDPAKREAYDAELAATRVEAAIEDEVSEGGPVDPAPVSLAKTEPVAGAPVPAVVDEPDTSDKADKSDESDESEDADATPAPADTPPRAPSTGPRTLALAAAGLAAVVAVALAIWLFTLPGVRADASPKTVDERADAQQKAALSVEGAAEQLVAPVLSYNHKTMDADLERLKDYVSTKMADKQAKAWPDITKEAISQEIVVEATATGTALTRVDPDGKRATVVVFIDQYVEKKGAQPFVLRMWATLEMVRASGSDDRWLLDDLCTDNSCG